MVVEDPESSLKVTDDKVVSLSLHSEDIPLNSERDDVLPSVGDSQFRSDDLSSQKALSQHFAETSPGQNMPLTATKSLLKGVSPQTSAARNAMRTVQKVDTELSAIDERIEKDSQHSKRFANDNSFMVEDLEGSHSFSLRHTKGG
jgi:hypothetical protein